METPFQKPGNHDLITENQIDEMEAKNENEAGDDPKWYDLEAQNIMDSQQLAEYISLCDEFIISQSPSREDQQNHKEKKRKTRLSDHYACLGAEDLKKDLEECQDYEQQNHKEKKCKTRLSDHYACLGAEDLKKDSECQDYELDPANIILDTPPDFRLSQLVILLLLLLFKIYCLILNLFLIFLTFGWPCLEFKFLQELPSQDSFIAWGGHKIGSAPKWTANSTNITISF